MELHWLTPAWYRALLLGYINALPMDFSSPTEGERLQLRVLNDRNFHPSRAQLRKRFNKNGIQSFQQLYPSLIRVAVRDRGHCVHIESFPFVDLFFFFPLPSPSKIASRGEMGRRVYVFALARYHNGVVGNFDRFSVCSTKAARSILYFGTRLKMCTK